MAPEPTTIIDSGRRVSVSACRDEITCSPSMGMKAISRGLAPVARTMWSASYSAPSTSMRPGAVSRPNPGIRSILFLFSRTRTPFDMVSATLRERATMASRLGRTSPASSSP